MVCKCIVIMQKYFEDKVKYKAILFDLDYTLFNESNFLREVILFSKIFSNPEENIRKISYSFRTKSHNIIDDILSLENKNTKKNSDYLFQIMKEINIELSCYKGIARMLNKLKENSLIKTCLVTNGVPEIQKNKLNILRLGKCFNQILFAKESGYQKPNNIPFLTALDYLKVEPESALYVGDNPLNDIKPSNKLGIDTLWIDHLGEDNIESTYRITNPNYLAEKITNL